VKQEAVVDRLRYITPSKWVVALGLPIIINFLPIGLKYNIQIYLAITLWAILMWMFELLPESLIGILIPVFYLLSGIATTNEAFMGWASSVPWVTLGGIIIGTVMITSGLAKRFAYKALSITGNSLFGIIVGISVTSFIITPFIPSIMGKISMMVPLVIGICQALKIEPKSKEASALMLVAFFSLWSPKMAFLTGSADSVLLAGVLGQQLGLRVSWALWAYEMFVPGLLWTIVSVFLVFILRPNKEVFNSKEVFTKYDELGPISKEEKKTIILLIVLFIILATDSIHKIDSAWTMIIMASLAFIPGIDLLKKSDIQKINFPIVFFLVGALTIGNLAKVTGTADLISKTILPMLQGKSELYIVLITWLFGVLSTFILNPLAAISALAVPMAEIFKSLGYNPYAGGYALIMGFNHAIFPYQIAPLMLVYGYGYLKLNHLIKIMIIRVIAGFIFMLVIVYPYWKLIGLF